VCMWGGGPVKLHLKMSNRCVQWFTKVVAQVRGSVSRFETGALAETFQATGERAASLAQHQHEQARTLVASFEAPFKVHTLQQHCQAGPQPVKADLLNGRPLRHRHAFV